jgi:hypothetical protein
MASSLRFPIFVAFQLCIPAMLYLLVGLYNGRSSSLSYLLPNYLFMAAPHLLVSLLTVWPKSRRAALLWVLSLLNVLLIAFQLWVLLAVPGRESGLAWVLYIPLWGAALAASAIIWLVAKRKAHSRPVAT